MAMVTIAFVFAGYENKKTASDDNQAGTIIVIDASVGATADLLMSELDTQLSQNSTDAIQTNLTSLRNRYAELAVSSKLDTAKVYAAKTQLFLNGNAEKTKVVTASNATITTLVSGIQNPLTAAEATAGRIGAVVRNSAEEMMKEAEFEANKVIDKIKREAMKAIDDVDAKVGEAKDKAGKALDESTEKANKEIDQARG